MDTRGIDQMLSELRSVSQAAQNKPVETAAPAAGGVNFADVLDNALKDVSAAQSEARQMAQEFSGQPAKSEPVLPADGAGAHPLGHRVSGHHEHAGLRASSEVHGCPVFRGN